MERPTKKLKTSNKYLKGETGPVFEYLATDLAAAYNENDRLKMRNILLAEENKLLRLQVEEARLQHGRQTHYIAWLERFARGPSGDRMPTHYLHRMYETNGRINTIHLRGGGRYVTFNQGITWNFVSEIHNEVNAQRIHNLMERYAEEDQANTEEQVN